MNVREENLLKKVPSPRPSFQNFSAGYGPGARIPSVEWGWTEL